MLGHVFGVSGIQRRPPPIPVPSELHPIASEAMQCGLHHRSGPGL